MASAQTDKTAHAARATETLAGVAEQARAFTTANADALLASVTAAAKGAQAVSNKVAGFTQANVERQLTAIADFAKVKSPQELFELQSKLARASFEAYTSQFIALSEAVSGAASETAKPVSAAFKQTFKGAVA